MGMDTLDEVNESEQHEGKTIGDTMMCCQIPLVSTCTHSPSCWEFGELEVGE